MIIPISGVPQSGKEPQDKVPIVKDKPAPVVGEQSAALFRALVAEKMKEGKSSEKS